MVVESDTPELNDERRALTQMLFVEGNHFCPSCEKSGDCKLQATAYDLGMMSPHYDHFFPGPPGRRLAPRAAARLQPLHPLLAVRAREPRRRRQERLRAVRPRHQDPADRQCEVGPPRRHRHRRHRQGGARLPGRRHPAQAPGIRVPLGRRVFDLKPISGYADASREDRRAVDMDDGRVKRRTEGRDDVARRLLRLPHVVPRPRRAPVPAVRTDRVRPLALHRHQDDRRVRPRHHRGRPVQRRERPRAARIPRALPQARRHRRLRDQRGPAGAAQPSAAAADPAGGLPVEARARQRPHPQRSGIAAAAQQGPSAARSGRDRLFHPRLPAVGGRHLEGADRHPRGARHRCSATASSTTIRSRRP